MSRRKNRHATVTLVAPAEAEVIDHEGNIVPTECTCKPKPRQCGVLHPGPKCPVADYPPWKNVDCEWSPHLHKFVWYEGLGKDKQLVDDDGTVIPKFDCYCKVPKKFHCGECGVRRDKEEGPWELITSKSSSSYGGTSTYVGKDRHYGDTLTFPDGTTVWASSAHRRKPGAPKPDFGVYLASSWDPECLAYRISWADYGLPEINYDMVIWAIEQAFEAAKTINVEVGCVGGHGRTGTVLACMATIAGVPAKDAVKWVKDNYCEHAVESKVQEWFVLWFDATRKGEVPPEKPKPEPKKSYSSALPGAGMAGSKTCKTIGCNGNIWGSWDYCWSCDKKKDKEEADAKKAATSGGTVVTASDTGTTVDNTTKSLPFHQERDCDTCGTAFANTVDTTCYRCRAKPSVGVDRSSKGWTQPSGSPICPGCDQQMVSSEVAGHIYYCAKLGCLVDTAIKSETYGWVYYNVQEQELATEKELPFIAGTFEDHAADVIAGDSHEDEPGPETFEEAILALEQQAASYWMQAELAAEDGDVSEQRNAVVEAMLCEDERAAIEHVRHAGHPGCPICGEPMAQRWKTSYQGTICVNIDCSAFNEEHMDDTMTIIFPGDYIESEDSCGAANPAE